MISTISRELPILIAGPTASGKSSLAMELAARDGRTVVNADALQVYSQWQLLSARPSFEDEAALPHALYGHIGRDIPYSVGHWLREVAALDRETLANIDTQNPARIQRAYEVQIATGRGMSAWHKDTPAPLLPSTASEAIVLRPDVPWLDARITQRFDMMMANGALDEAAAALPHWDARASWSQAIGAPELIAHLRGEMTLPQARDVAILASRQYAKRQRTWFRARMRDWHSISLP